MKLSRKDAFIASAGVVLGGVLHQLKRVGAAVWSAIKRDGVRVALMVAAGSGLLAIDEPVALALRRPELAAFLMWSGLFFHAAALSHVLRRLFFWYIDLRTVALEARKGSVGAGLVFLGVSIVLAVALALLPIMAKADPLPARAHQYLPILKAEQERLWPDMPMPAMLGAQVEQETCITLTHRMCWSPRAELRTSRERGVGLGQITMTTRFDSLSELRASTGDELRGWSWGDDSIYDPRYQLRGLVLKDKQTWKCVGQWATTRDRLAGMLAGYNGGCGGVLSDRKVCGGTAGCDKGQWFEHVEHTSLKAKRAANGYGKSFFEINREYVRNVTGPRLGRYQGLL